jgi:protein O-GlcNAc transferase
VSPAVRANPGFEQQLAVATKHHQAGRLDVACALYQRLQPLAPNDFRVLHLGGVVLLQCNRHADAVKWLERAARLQPRSGATRMCLGLSLDRLGQGEAAVGHLREAVRLEPGNAEAWTNLGGVLFARGDVTGATDAHRRAVQANPRFVLGWCNLGRTLMQAGRAVEALDAHEHALALAPGDTHALKGRAQSNNGCHRLEAALADFEAVIAADPADHEAASLRLYLLHFLDGQPAERIAREHREFGARFTAIPSRVFTAMRDPAKRLRVAFLSPDLRGHSVAFFLRPLLAHLNREEFEIVLYHESALEDTFSAALRAHAAIWRNVHAHTDAELESLVLADAPDILVELAGHTAFKRPLPLARRLAPVQGTYLGYPNTTGLPSIDFRLTDALADPAGVSDGLHTEALVRFSPCAWAYEPPAQAPDVPPLPCLARVDGAVTFGSFNNLMKLSPATLRLWARVLDAVPDSMLALKGDVPDVEAFYTRLKNAGLPAERCRLLPRTAGLAEHLACYGQIDIALDPVTYHGTTTTCEALWMGRPVVSLAGESHVRRVGVSLLTAAGQGDCVAGNEDEFVEIAVRLAGDRAALAARCAGMRTALAASPLLDHAGQARRFGEALREQWRSYCHGAS